MTSWTDEKTVGSVDICSSDVMSVMASQLKWTVCPTACWKNKTSTFHISVPYDGNPQVTGGFTSQGDNSAETVSLTSPYIFTLMVSESYWNVYCLVIQTIILTVITCRRILGWMGLWGFLWWAPSANRKDHHGVSSGWSSVWHRSNTGLSSTQYEQILIYLHIYLWDIKIELSYNSIEIHVFNLGKHAWNYRQRKIFIPWYTYCIDIISIEKHAFVICIPFKWHTIRFGHDSQRTRWKIQHYGHVGSEVGEIYWHAGFVIVWT